MVNQISEKACDALTKKDGGSADFTPSSLEKNDEVTARIEDKTICTKPTPAVARAPADEDGSLTLPPARSLCAGGSLPTRPRLRGACGRTAVAALEGRPPAFCPPGFAKGRLPGPGWWGDGLLGSSGMAGLLPLSARKSGHSGVETLRPQLPLGEHVRIDL
ncbi:hypothetical protein ACOKM5_07415 [Streptomyces sp. BH097]|uniref:hypothetical protein n=1 Tax=unclassified Streptomyces TaxID=2593676 RepID=UPI003BB54E3B